MKQMKGNHRRTNKKAFKIRGVIGNTYNTPTFSRGAINKKIFCVISVNYGAFLFE